MERTGRRRHSVAKRKLATIRDVAQRAGVSTATVSRTLADPERVTERTRLTVLAAIDATGYTPNASARSLRARSTRMVLALLPGMDNAFFNPILNAFEDVLSEAGYGLIIGDTRHSLEREAHYVRLIRAGQVDGLALFTGQLPRNDDYVVGVDEVPIALICNEIPGEDGLSLFDVADHQAARTATEHLIAQGHRRIAHIAGPPLNIEARQRQAGYADALAAAGLAMDDELIWGGGFEASAGLEAAARYAAITDRPTAVFAACDETAIVFIRTLRDAGVSVPGDVSVVGFDDVEYAAMIDPPLTTMRQPRADLGRAAAEDLLRRMARGAAHIPPTRVRLDCTLVVRDSTRRIAGDERGRTTGWNRGRTPAPTTGAAAGRAGTS